MHKKGNGVCYSKSEIKAMEEEFVLKGKVQAYEDMSNWLRAEVIHHACNTPLPAPLNRMLVAAADMAKAKQIGCTDPISAQRFIEGSKYLRVA